MMTGPDGQKCADCKWWNPYDEAERRMVAGEADCRRRSPTVVSGGYGGHTRWPRVNIDYWCGDFEQYNNPVKTCDAG